MPAAATWSRQGDMRRMPRRWQPTMMSGSDHCLRTVAVLIDSRSDRGGLILLVTASGSLAVETVHDEEAAHARAGEVRIAQQCGGVGELEQLDEMRQAARALLASDHDEMILMAVEPGQEDDARLVEARRGAEDVPRQRHRRCEDRVEFSAVAA